MRIQCPDINVLVALHDATHQHHDRAHAWFASVGKLGWATCPLTENGFIRLFSQPALPNNVGSPAAAMVYLEDMMRTHVATHQFWPDNISLRDKTLFRLEVLRGHRQITDVYLLGLCQRHSGAFVTLDAALTADALLVADADLIHLLL